MPYTPWVLRTLAAYSSLFMEPSPTPEHPDDPFDPAPALTRAGLEDGLARTETQHRNGADGWSLIETNVVRLGLVLPSNVPYVPHVPDPRRPEQLTGYLLAAYPPGAGHQSASHLRSGARKARRLDYRPRTLVARQLTTAQAAPTSAEGE